jgi:hypothetical protein
MRIDKPQHMLPSIIDEAFYLSADVQEAQMKAEMKNAAIRRAERKAFHDEWIKPENIAKRKEENERVAAASLARIREALNIGEPEPIPPDDQLPRHMRGQSPSTIRAFLRHQREGQMAIGLERTLERVYGPAPIAIAVIERGQVVKPTFWQRLFAWLRRK